MPNYSEQYFNQDAGQPAGFSDQDRTIIKEIEVSGDSTNKKYMAQLVVVRGAGVSLSTGDINVELSHSTDSVRLGDATTLTKVATGGFLLVSGQTEIKNVSTAAGGFLLVSGQTSIKDVAVSGSSLQVILTDNEGMIGSVVGKSKKPQISITRPSNTTTYSILDTINSGTTVMERFNIARSNNKLVWCLGGHMSSSVSAATSLNCDLHIFSSGLTVTSDNTLWQPNVNELTHHLGVVSFSSWKVLGNRSVSEGSIEQPFLLTPDPDNPSSVWSELIARNAYVPSSAEILTASLDISQD